MSAVDAVTKIRQAEGVIMSSSLSPSRSRLSSPPPSPVSVALHLSSSTASEVFLRAAFFWHCMCVAERLYIRGLARVGLMESKKSSGKIKKI